MDFRIGAKSPVYGARQTSKVADKQLKQSFAMKMAEVRPPRQDIVEISGNPLAQRLENVHQQINGMDFTGKTSEEVYKFIVDVYDQEFGFVGNLHYSDLEAYNRIYPDRQQMIENTVPNYQQVKKELHYRAMGYDKMTNQEKIAEIKKRVGGNTIIDKFSIINELARAKVITSDQQSTLYNSLYRKAEMEYCAEKGFDYLTWSCHPEKYYGNSSEDCSFDQWQKSLMAWATKKEVTWLEVIESIQDYPAIRDQEKDVFMKDLEEVTGLLLRSDNI